MQFLDSSNPTRHIALINFIALEEDVQGFLILGKWMTGDLV